MAYLLGSQPPQKEVYIRRRVSGLVEILPHRPLGRLGRVGEGRQARKDGAPGGNDVVPVCELGERPLREKAPALLERVEVGDCGRRALLAPARVGEREDVVRGEGGVVGDDAGAGGARGGGRGEDVDEADMDIGEARVGLIGGKELAQDSFVVERSLEDGVERHAGPAGEAGDACEERLDFGVLGHLVLVRLGF